ncbi:hypothetical protein Tco_1300459 [Tanacetum coccineum]
MQKTILKQQYENFTASRFEGLDKTYDWFQKLISQLRIPLDEIISNEDANLKTTSSSSYADDVMVFLLVIQSNSGYDWSFQAEEGPTDFALMAHLSSGSSSSSSSDSENGIGFDSQMIENELHDIYKNNSEVFVRASDSSVNKIEEENNYVNYRFKKVDRYHAVPPPYTENYMPSRPDFSFAGLDNSVYKTNVSETITSVPRNESTASKSSKDKLEQPKDVRPSAPIVEE